MVLDTETADLKGLTYDVGYTIACKKGIIRHSFTGLVREVFTDAKSMMGAFYARKLFSHYAPMLDKGEIHLYDWSEIVDIMRADMLAHGVNVIAAYNLGFDRRALRHTHRKLGGSGAIVQQSVKQLDLWQFACEAKLRSATYRALARELGWITKANNYKTGAEFAYRYVTGDWDFIEDHTALSDAIIETRIMADCYAAKKSVPYGIVDSAPWRLVAQEG